ncbi:DUF1674 domain-containing protein [Luteimonas marina]|uniref:DUF1674 domain-containing protein n=1 Tax=Luteimonas marina TaxID=488485 RepID=UPI0013156E37|nr:succinate dehydrogenase assembly factor 4 [Luteimonas marina]
MKGHDILGEHGSGQPAGEAEKPVAETGPANETGSPRMGETGGREGLDPTRYGDWEKNGRCIDF